MRLTEDRISHLSHLILNGLVDQGFVFIREIDEGTVRNRIKKVFVEELQIEDAVDDKVRAKIASYKRSIPEGSNEWHILYQRFYNENMGKRGKS
jgi:hypothetical protein